MSAAIRTLPQPSIVILRQPAPSVSTRGCEVSCASCNLRESCLSGGLPAEDLERVESIVYARRRLKRGQALFKAGDEFHSVYAIRSGFFKTSLIDDDGREQVTGFFMGGEFLGMDGVGSGRYDGDAIALEDSDVCMMPYVLIEKIGREVPALQRRLHAMLAGEIVRGYGVMLLLGSMTAEQRLAAFLLNLSRRYLRRGYSGSRFLLRMTREEIGSYLGLKIETVSRLFTAFHQDGLLDVQYRELSIVDIQGLERLLAD